MSNEKIISEATPVRIGLVIAFLLVFASGIWWAASINAKLDSIISNQAVVGGAISEIKSTEASTAKDLNDLTLRVAILESKNGDSAKK